MAKTFYGCRSDNVCAYCWKHHLSLTPRQLKTRGCLCKGCGALRRVDTHPYWANREKSRAMRAARKVRMEALYLAATHQEV